MDIKPQFDRWWGALTLKGDPMRRPRLTQEAFEAGYLAGLERAARTCDKIASKERARSDHADNRPFAGTVGEVYANEARAAEDCAEAIRALSAS